MDPLLAYQFRNLKELLNKIEQELTIVGKGEGSYLDKVISKLKAKKTWDKVCDEFLYDIIVTLYVQGYDTTHKLGQLFQKKDGAMRNFLSTNKIQMTEIKQKLKG